MEKLTEKLKEWLKEIIFALILVSLINIFIMPTMVFSISMNPTLVEKDVLIIYKTSNFERGDIVTFKSDLPLTKNDIQELNPIQQLLAKQDPHKKLIKRVIGLPGDSILIKNESVYVNGKELSESYLGSQTYGKVDIKSIPDNEYFLMGDNRGHSADSRDSRIGCVSQERIIGKSVLRIFPFKKVGVVE